MSAIARWSYKNTATIKPFIELDLMSGQTLYGPEYEIACNWAAKSEQARSNDGAEFISRHEIFTEDPRPKYLDMIKLGGRDDWEQIRSATMWEMAMFGDVPDFKMVT